MEWLTSISAQISSSLSLSDGSQEKRILCVVCIETVNAKMGFACPHKCGTFTCWNCLLRSYHMALKHDASFGCCSKEGEIVCSGVKCKCPVKVVDLAKAGASEAILTAQEQLKLQVLTSKAVIGALNDQEKQIRWEYERIEKIRDPDERTAEILRKKIVHELTLRCPRCREAFLDFDGCFALVCSNKSCGCGFCAWCLKDCDDNAHKHVLKCPENPKKTGDHDSYFNTDQAFKEHHRQKRIVTIKALIDKAFPTMSAIEKLKIMVNQDLQDLHISFREVCPMAAYSWPKKTSLPPPPMHLPYPSQMSRLFTVSREFECGEY